MKGVIAMGKDSEEVAIQIASIRRTTSEQAESLRLIVQGISDGRVISVTGKA